MRLAFLLYKYFPYGGLQRDFLCFVKEAQRRGHTCRVYCISWQGERPAGVDIRQAPARGLSNHRRNHRFSKWVAADLVTHPVEGVVGFNRVSGLDIYFAADPCFVHKAIHQRSGWYRCSARYRHFAEAEQRVFGPDSETHVLLLSDTQRREFKQHYDTPDSRMHLLPPGVASQRRAPEDAPQRRRAMRTDFGLDSQELSLLFVGSGFVTKGLDRAITALANMRQAQPAVKARLLVAGQDQPRRFQRQAKKLGVADAVEFLGGRDDVRDLMLAADVLLHPAVAEVAGVVLLEAVAAGLTIITTEVCGYAPHVTAARAGAVLPEPFTQKQLDRALMRCIDGVYRAECRRSALQYASVTDIYAMPKVGVDLLLQLLEQQQAGSNV